MFIERKRLRRTALLGSTAACLACAANTPAAFAQDFEVEEIEQMVVTGSRIRRTGIDTVRPAIGVDAEVLDIRAFTNIADALNEVPAFGGGVDPNGAQNAFTVGQNFVDLFDLGSQRTLTLVNGRRFVSSNTPTVFGGEAGLQVDLNTIPVALLERIEVVPLAGAAVYGSDSIAGTVNVILRDDYEGFEISGQYGITEEGDGRTYQVQSVLGTNFADDRGNIVFSVEYSSQKGLLLTDRPGLTENNPDFLSFGGQDLDGDGEDDDVDGDGLPDTFQRIVDGGQRVQLLTGGGAVSAPGASFIPSFGLGALDDGNFYQFQPDGTLEACEPGETPAGSAFFAYGGTCGVDFFDSVDQIRSPVNRLVATSIGHFNFTDNIRYVQEFMFANSRAVELVNQGGFQSFPFTGTSGPVTMSVDNPFLTEQARNILVDNGLTEFRVNRFNNDLVSAGEDSTENFTWRVFSGFEGEFEYAERSFFWDFGIVFGQSDVETQGQGIVDGRFVNAIDAVRLDDASLAPILDTLGTTDEDGDGFLDGDLNFDGVVNSADAAVFFATNGGSGVPNPGLGDIVCQVNIDNALGELDGANLPPSGGGITDEDLPFVDGCVPLNLFGEGAASPEALAFINGGPGITSSDIGQRVITLNVGGEAIDLPAGPIGFVVGFENRRETAAFIPGLGTAVPITRSSPFPPTTGKLNTLEFYGETLIPLISADMDIPLIRNLEIEGSARRVRNTITDPVGEQSRDSVWAYEYGGRISPVRDITIRGTFASAIRTPSLVELFTPRVQAFISGDDPCDRREVNQGPNPDLRRANCIAAGITDPDNFTSNIQNATISNGATTGNPDLIPERAKSWTIGAVIEPRWVDNLTITADYFNISITDRIENFDFEALAETCFDSTDFPNVPACNQFTRDATGQVDSVTELFLNAANSIYRGVSMQMLYDFELASAFGLFGNSDWANRDFGVVRFNFNVLRTITDKTQIVTTRPADQDAGDFADPTWQGTFDTTWERGPWRWFYRVIYQDSPLLDETRNEFFLDDDDNIIFKTRARLLHNMSIAYTLLDQTTVQFGVDNLLDRKPNRRELAIGYFGVSEELGRRFTFRLRSRF